MGIINIEFFEYTKINIPKRNIYKIIKAEYGTEIPLTKYSGGRWVNVKDILIDHVKDGGLEIIINNDIMGGDPALNVKKILRLWYEYEPNNHDNQTPVITPIIPPKSNESE